MNGNATLRELFDEAAGEKTAIELGDGLTVQLSVLGNLLVNDQSLGEVSAFTLEAVARGLREAAKDKYLDSAQNPLIKLGD